MKFKKLNNSEDGIAIVFALGVVSLLFVIGLGFVTTAIIKNKTAENYASKGMAQMVAQSALERSKFVMKEYFSETTEDIDYTKIVSHEGDGSITYTENLSDFLATVENGNNQEVFSWDTRYPGETYTPATDSEDVTWQYIPANSGINTPITARFAFIVTDSPDTPTILRIFGKKIDPSTSIDSGLNAFNNSTNAISEYYPASEATSVDADGNAVIGRPGRDISELFLATMSLIGQTDTASRLSADNISGSPSGLLAYGARWSDLDELCDSFADAAAPITDAAKTSLKNLFAFNYLPIPEAFWTDTDYSIHTKAGMKHRFNLTRTDWNDLSVDDILDTQNNIIAYNANDDGDTEKCIPWLANWKYSGDFGSTDSCKKQIVANLIDYNDSNYIATTNETVTTSAQDFNASYVGLEKCPYINELKLIFSIAFWNYGPWPPTETPGDQKRLNGFNFRLQLGDIEVVNMYDESNTALAEVFVDYDFKYDVSFQLYYIPYYRWYGPFTTGIQTVPNRTITRSFTSVSSSPTDYGYQEYNNFDDWTGWKYLASHLLSGFPDSYINIESFSAYLNINEVKVKLRNSSDANILYDFSYVDDSVDTQNLILDYTVPTGGNTVQYIYTVSDFEVNDPRQNLLSDKWELHDPPSPAYIEGLSASAGISAASALNYGSTLNAKNSNYDLPTLPDSNNYDPEPTATEPWLISTAYVRNAPMKSPWELGFIHRGSNWQTINLKKYNSLEGLDGAGNAYYDDSVESGYGDANILDQVKMTTATETYGKINVNSEIEEVLTVLYEKVRVGTDLKTASDPGNITGTNEVTTTFAQAFAADLIEKSGGEADSSKHFFSRAEMLKNSGMSAALSTDTTVQGISIDLDRDTDATQEELIGKFINLTTSLEHVPDQFCVVVVAQPIQDIGGVTLNVDTNDDGDVDSQIPTTIGTYDVGGDRVLGIQMMLFTVRRDPDTGELYVIDYDFLD